VASAGRPARFTALVGDATHQIEVRTLDDGRYEVTVDGRTHVVDALPTGSASWSLLIGQRTAEVSMLAKGDSWTVETAGRTRRLRLLDERARRAHRTAVGGASGDVRAIMPGKVVTVLVAPGATVEQDQGLLVIEAMKMENEVKAPRAGTVKELRVAPGQAVEAGELLAVIE
jgi:biotin carboxyl carrier protein